MKKKKAFTKILGIAMAMVCAISSMFVVSSVCANAADTQSSVSSTDESTEPTIDKEPGIYPIDNDHFLIVYPDHTFRLMHGEPPTTNPWIIA